MYYFLNDDMSFRECTYEEWMKQEFSIHKVLLHYAGEIYSTRIIWDGHYECFISGDPLNERPHLFIVQVLIKGKKISSIYCTHFEQAKSVHEKMVEIYTKNTNEQEEIHNRNIEREENKLHEKIMDLLSKNTINVNYEDAVNICIGALIKSLDKIYLEDEVSHHPFTEKQKDQIFNGIDKLIDEFVGLTRIDRVGFFSQYKIMDAINSFQKSVLG